MIPDFENGELPPGEHETTLEEISQRLGFNEHRRNLIEKMRSAVINLAQAGVQTVWIDGSFVTSKEEPADIDGCWDTHGADRSKIDRVLLDTSRAGRVQMKRRYGVDFFPNVIEQSSNVKFSEFFQTNRDGETRGILVLKLGEEDDHPE